MGRILDFDGARGGRLSQPPRQYPAQITPNKFNQYSRRSLLAQFVLGSSVRKLGKQHPSHERGIEQDIREALLGGEPGGKQAA